MIHEWRRYSLRQELRSSSRQGGGGRARGAQAARQQSEPFHLPGDGLLHRRPRSGRHHRSRPARRPAYRRVARRRARRDRHPYLRDPHPPRSFAGDASPQGGDRGAGARARTAPRRPGFTIEAVATPGHTANHMAFAYREANILFSGDHVMAWSTPVVAPPDGAMGDYMASLEKLALRSEPVYLPGHGGAVREAPRFVQSYIRHRQAREASILRRLGKGEADIPTIVRAIYIGLDPRLTKAAGLSVLAHIEDLATRRLVVTDGEPAIDGRYRLPR